MAERRPSPVLTIILVVIVIAAGGGIFAFLYYENHKSPSGGPLLVQEGDNVTVNYIGVFASGPQQGRVFDTSQYNIALNNASWPKALQYSSRGGSPSDYTPLAVHVGPTAPGSGYAVGNQTFGTVVPGFWQGLLGLQGNQTRYITVPQNLGYSSSLINASCYVTQPLTYTYPVVETVSPTVFQTLFPNATARPGTQFPDPVYGWTVQVMSTNSTAVVFENLPSLGMTTDPQGWAVLVTNITTTNITLQNQLSPSQAGQIQGTSPGASVCGVSTFIVSQVNLGAGTYVQNFGGPGGGNKQVYGQTLIFIVSVVDILPP
jgi:FKBP-type peptidyl-prolyl cis-trans isomerase